MKTETIQRQVDPQHSASDKLESVLENSQDYGIIENKKVLGFYTSTSPELGQNNVLVEGGTNVSIRPQDTFIWDICCAAFSNGGNVTLQGSFKETTWGRYLVPYRAWADK